MAHPALLFAAVPTPLDEALRVAIAPLAAHCERLFQQGCDGIVLFGTTGEGTFFSSAEKVAALRNLIAAGVVPSRILLASGACALADAAVAVAAARDLGCKGTLVLPPFFTKQVDDEGLAEWMDALLAKSGGGALFLYHIPAVAGVGFSPAFARRLLDRDRGAIQGVKDSTTDSALARALAPEGRKGLYVSTEVGLAANVAAGMAGTISASLNITLPLVRSALAGHVRADARVARVREYLVEHSLVWAVKTALADLTGNPLWRRLAPPHRAPANVHEASFLARLRELQQDVA